jgi:hypothetical protein
MLSSVRPNVRLYDFYGSALDGIHQLIGAFAHFGERGVEKVSGSAAQLHFQESLFFAQRNGVVPFKKNVLLSRQAIAARRQRKRKKTVRPRFDLAPEDVVGQFVSRHFDLVEVASVVVLENIALHRDLGKKSPVRAKNKGQKQPDKPVSHHSIRFTGKNSIHAHRFYGHARFCCAFFGNIVGQRL